MKSNAVPWPAITRRIIPNATVVSQTSTPAPSEAPFWRRTSTMSQPIASPTAKGHVVETMPERLSPWWWLARPMATKSTTTRMSTTIQRRAISNDPTGINIRRQTEPSGINTPFEPCRWRRATTTSFSRSCRPMQRTAPCCRSPLETDGECWSSSSGVDRQLRGPVIRGSRAPDRLRAQSRQSSTRSQYP